MKKALLTLALLFTFSFSVTSKVNAETNPEIDSGVRVEGMEEDDGTLWWRYAYWETTSEFPDYIGYVDYIEGKAHFEVGLTQNTRDNQLQILEMVPNSKEDIVFTDASYSREEQKDLYSQLTSRYMTEDSSFYFYGSGWEKDSIAFYTASENVEEYTDYFENKYDDQVVIRLEEDFRQSQVDWVGYYLDQLPPVPEAGTEEYVIYNHGEDDGTIDWQFQYWSITETFPENVGFVRMQQNQMTWEIGLVDNTPEERQDILNLIPNSQEEIEFLDARYSNNELTRVQEEITEEFFMSGDHPIYSSGIQSDIILVTVDSKYLDEYTELFQERYGDIVQVEPGAEPLATVEESGSLINRSIDSAVWIGTLAVFSAFTVIFLYHRQSREKIKKQQTVSGELVEGNERVSSSSIIKLVKEAEYEPSRKVYEQIIYNSIKKGKK